MLSQISLSIFRVKFLALTMIVFIGACARDEATSSDGVFVSNIAMIGGTNEPTFEEFFDVHLQSPMRESVLIAMLKERGIQYRIISNNLPPSRHRRELDVSKYDRVIEIYGGVSNAPPVAQIFRAYIDKQGEVEFIENAFAYAPP